jgi:7-carboxy-7-deazaguanine synthase
MKIKINEIFTSIDGEVTRWGQGGLTTFIRFSGCGLRCSYCDTKYAQGDEKAKEMSVLDIIGRVKTPRVTITGGEPLMQRAGLEQLINELARKEIKMTIETNGHYRAWTPVWAQDLLGWVIDFKFEYFNRMLMANFEMATERDWIKFVVDREEDYKNALQYIRAFKLHPCKARFAMGTTGRGLSHAQLVDKLIKDEQWDVTLNVQLHKCIGVA